MGCFNVAEQNLY